MDIGGVYFLLRSPRIAPVIVDNEPNKRIPKPVSLVSSKKTPPIPIKISPILIRYCGFIFNSFFIVYEFKLNVKK
jgi:hypothetical protein